MPNVVNNFKETLASEFSKANAFSDLEGSSIFGKINSALSEDNEIEEKWSQKYKDSIDCNNPKGFSQRAHCQGRKKKENKEATGAASAGQFSAPLFGETNEETYCEVCKKHGSQCKCKQVTKKETKEATGSSGSGSYVTPAAWAKSTSKKDWRGKSKTQIPGGKFVTIKKKCKTFPYCNQGDIKALKLYENEMVKNVISKISKEQNINENVIKSIIQYEIEKLKNK